jgi:hypothetical protein
MALFKCGGEIAFSLCGFANKLPVSSTLLATASIWLRSPSALGYHSLGVGLVAILTAGLGYAIPNWKWIWGSAIFVPILAASHSRRWLYVGALDVFTAFLGHIVSVGAPIALSSWVSYLGAPAFEWEWLRWA